MKKVLFTATVDSHILAFHIPFLKYFKEEGYEVHVATNGNEKIPYCDKKHYISFERSPFKLNNLKAIKQMKKLVEKEKFDIIHTHTPMGSVVTRLGARKARKNGTRVIYTAHGFHFYKGAPLLNWLMFYPVEKFLSRYTDTLITINKEDYERAKKKFKKCRDIQYVPGVGIDEEKFNFEMTEKEKNELRKSLGLKKDDFVMIYPARLDKNKNQILLIESMKKLVDMDNKIHLLLPGKDELNGYYSNVSSSFGLEKNIHFLGHRDDIPKLLKISNLGVASSLREGLGLNLVEAAYVGLPILAMANRGHSEIINKNNGYLFSNQEDFVEQVIKIKENKKVKSGKKTVEIFMLSNIMKKMKKIYSLSNNFKKILFVHTEEKVKIDDKMNCYTDGCYNNKIWNRYLKISNSITAIFRKDKNQFEFNEARKKFNDIPKNIHVVFVNDRKSSIKNYFSPIIAYKNKKIIKNEILKSDAIIIRVPCDDSYIAFKYAKKFNKNIIVEVVGCPFDTLWHHGIRGKILAIPTYLKMRKCVKNANKVIYVTNNFLQKRYPNKFYNIGCSDVELDETTKSVLNTRLEKIKKTNEKKIVVGTIGNVDNKYKGQKDVIKAISILQKEGYQIEYRLVGNGNQSYLKKIAAQYNVNNLSFFGSIPHSKISEYLDSIDIYIHPSYTEGLCRAIIEAISRACPTIVSNVGGNPELVNSEFVFQKGNIKELTKKIKSLLNKNKLSEQALLNYNKSLNYNSERLNKIRNDFYQKLVNNNPKRVLHVVNRMGYGGIETFIMNIYRKIDKNVIQFDFAVHSDIPGDYDDEIRKLGGNIYYFTQRRKNFIRYSNQWKQFLMKNSINYSAIHMHVSSLTTIVPLIYAKKNEIQNIIVHAHSTNEIGLIHKITCFFNKKRILNYATKYFACSRLAGDFVFGNKNYQIITNGIDMEKYHPNNTIRKKIRKELNVDNSTICYIHVGRFCYAKNHEFLIEIFSEIHKKNQNSKLFLIGDGELKKEICDRIEKNNLKNSIILLGTKSNVNEYLMAMDAFIFPSRYEGLPISIVESQASGLTTFISNNVTKEVKLSNYIFFLSLKAGPIEWANKIINTDIKEKNLNHEIVNFDINCTIDELMKSYRRF